MRPETIVVGGGIAGLACAWRLARAGVQVLLLEAERTPGGNVRTETVEGFRVEWGPHTFLASARQIFDLAEEAGLGGEVIPARRQSRARFIARGGRLHAIPSGPWSFLTSRLLSPRGKLALLGEPWRRQRGLPGDTAARFFERRFGPEAARVLAGAFVSGVYAGDPAALSAPAAFPLFWDFEQQAGSMIRGALRLRSQRRAERRALGEPAAPARRGLYSFREGLGQLPQTLARRLGGRCRPGCRALELRRGREGFQVATAAGPESAAQLVLSVPPAEAARLLRAVDGELADLLAGIPMAPVAVTYLGFRGRQEEIPDGFGFLAPRGEEVRTLGVLFPSRIFDGRAPGTGDLLTGFAGGMLDPGALELGDEALAALVLGDLERLTGLRRRPDCLRVARHPAAIPQLVLGHLERLAAARRRLEALPGLHLAGNYLKGVGMKEAVGSGFEAAEAVIARGRLAPPAREEVA